MSADDVFVYLASTPLFSLTVTLVAYLGATHLQRRFAGNPAMHPVLISMLALGLMLELSDIDYETYFSGAQFIHFLLGPATVALAVPLHRQLSRVRQDAAPVAVSLLCGSTTAIGSAVVLSSAMGADDRTVASLAPKSATTPVAMALSERIGGVPSLTAAVVVLTGITGAVLGPGLLRSLRIHDQRAIGLALGTASHGIGTAKALEVGGTAAAFAGIAFAGNAVLTALLIAVLDPLIP